MRCDEGKKAFTRHADATKAVIKWSWGATYGKNGRRAGKRARTPIRVYLCEHCGQYHYTSHRTDVEKRVAVSQTWGAPPRASAPTIADALEALRSQDD